MTLFASRKTLFGLGLVGLMATSPAFAADIARLTAQATAGNAQAQFDLGNAYIKGDGVAIDRWQGVKWYLKAADQGLAQAQSELALQYADDGQAGDKAEADKWIVLATDADTHYLPVMRTIEAGMTIDDVHKGHLLAQDWQTNHPHPVNSATIVGH